MNFINLTEQAGLNPKWVAGTNGGEYATFCPECGGNDRFRIWPNKQNGKCAGSYWCRKCKIGGDSIKFCRKYLGMTFKEAAQCVNATMSEKPNSFFKIRRHFTPVKVEPRSNLWLEMANAFVEGAHRAIFQNSEALEYLKQRGLPQEAVIRYKIGYNVIESYPNREDWGLVEAETKIWLPIGIVIPAIDPLGNITKLKIRNAKWQVGSSTQKYVAVGAQTGLSIVGTTANKEVMAVVESELDAYALDYAVGDFVIAVAAGNYAKKPDVLSDHLAKKMPNLLICYDNDEPKKEGDVPEGLKMLQQWQSLYPHAKAYPTPIGKDIGEAIEMGFDVRSWILEMIPKQNNVKNSSLEVAKNITQDIVEQKIEIATSPTQSTEIIDPITGEVFESINDQINKKDFYKIKLDDISEPAEKINKIKSLFEPDDPFNCKTCNKFSNQLIYGQMEVCNWDCYLVEFQKQKKKLMIMI